MKKQKLNGDQPATQHDLALWGGRLTERIDGVEERLGGVEGRLDGVEARLGHLEQKMDTMKNEIIHEFKVVAENIHQDVAGANRDEILLLKDKVAALEQHTG